MNDEDARLHHHICSGPHWHGLTRLGVAVSGGGDSVALLHLLADCARDHGVALEAATVNHGLRPEAGAEAAFVAKTCAALGLRHEVLRWQGWDGTGNLQAEARGGRYRLLAGWAQARALDSVALAHTANDQAETFLMRLGREAGVDGLAAMRGSFARDGARFWRPTLALQRDDLRGYLRRHGQGWCEDPSNDDPSYDRVRARKALETLKALGIDVAGLRSVAMNLATARDALADTTRDTARLCARIEAGDVVFDRAALAAAPEEITRRLLVAALTWISGTGYAPRREAVAAFEAAVLHGKTHTLHGCLGLASGTELRLCREVNAVKDLRAPLDAPWDNRWRVTGRDVPDLEIRALGEAVKDCPSWRETGLPRASLMASPAVWQGEALVAAPVAGLANGYTAEIDHPKGDFYASVLSH